MNLNEKTLQIEDLLSQYRLASDNYDRLLNEKCNTSLEDTTTMSMLSHKMVRSLRSLEQIRSKLAALGHAAT